MSSPYLRAFEAYHTGGPPFISWTSAMEFHLQLGIVIATPRLFALARWVPGCPSTWHLHPALEHFALSPAARTHLHLWIAAGPLAEFVRHARTLTPSATHITFQRGTRSAETRCLPLARLHSGHPPPP